MDEQAAKRAIYSWLLGRPSGMYTASSVMSAMRTYHHRNMEWSRAYISYLLHRLNQDGLVQWREDSEHEGWFWANDIREVILHKQTMDIDT